MSLMYNLDTLMSLKYNGALMLNDRLPHPPQAIVPFTCHQIGTAERAIKIVSVSRLLLFRLPDQDAVTLRTVINLPYGNLLP